MTTFVNSSDAARLLGVSKPTLYAYVSRGIVSRRTAIDGRSSLYDREQLERLVARSRRRTVSERPSIDVRISSAITHLDDRALTMRGHDALDLAATATYEQVAELLWTGSLPTVAVTWPVDREALATCRAVVDAAGVDAAGAESARVADPIVALTLTAAALADSVTPADTPADTPDDTPADTHDGAPLDSAAASARRLLALVPTVLGGPQRGPFAERLTRAWVRRPSPELIAAVSRALILLADHELATSTLAVRVAASVRTDPMSAVVAGLATVRGPLHGAASRAAAEFLDEAATIGAAAAVGRRLDAGERLPGFGHTVYRNGDPRFGPVLDAVRSLPVPRERIEMVDSVIAEAGRVIGHLPNVDLGLGALIQVGDLPRDAPIFAVARIAGWIAHYIEELDARPVRFRGLATRVPA